MGAMNIEAMLQCVVVVFLFFLFFYKAIVVVNIARSLDLFIPMLPKHMYVLAYNAQTNISETRDSLMKLAHIWIVLKIKSL